MKKIDWMKVFCEKELSKDNSQEDAGFIRIMNILKDNLQKHGAKTEDITAWKNWIYSETDFFLSFYSLDELRTIIGSVMEHVNEISKILMLGIRNIDSSVVERAQAVADDVYNFNYIPELCQKTIEILDTIPKHETLNENNSNVIYVIKNMCSSLMHASLPENKKASFEAIASGEMLNRKGPELPDMINQSQAMEVLTKTIYNGERTLRILREILQNSVDAAVENSRRNKITPTVKIYTYYARSGNVGNYYDKTPSMDLIVSDNGIGMNDEDLKSKFYILFSSGKKEQEGSTGGHGVAKAIIQESPQQGWSLDTNSEGGNYHSSRFHKNLYSSTPKNENFQHPEIQTSSNGTGTTISLYSIPFSSSEEIMGLCGKYAMGNVDIYLNNSKIETAFKISDMNSINEGLDKVADEVSDTEFEKDLVQKSLNEEKESMQGDINNLEFEYEDENGNVTSYVKAAIKINKKTQTSWCRDGGVYVFLNDQYQFELSTTVPRCDLLICIYTNIKSGQSHYPFDLGRENIIGDIGESVKKVVDSLVTFLKKITENEVMKQGLNIYTVNGDKSPASVLPSAPTDDRELRLLMLNKDLVQTVEDTKKEIEEQENDEAPTQEQDFYEQNEEEANTGTQNSTSVVKPTTKTPSEIKRDKIDAVLGNQIEQKLTDMGLTAEEREIVNAGIDVILDNDDFSLVKKQEEMKKVIDCIKTPVEVIIQKGFVSEELAHQRIELTTNLMITWSYFVSECINKIREKRGITRNSQYVPGLIFSNEALGLCFKQKEKDYSCICVNPLTVAAMADPTMFNQMLMGSSVSESVFDNNSVDSPSAIERVMVFMKSTAVHEICHFLYPEYYGNSRFHDNITILESLTRGLETKLTAHVKLYMKGLRADSKKLIRAVNKDRKKMLQTNGVSSHVVRKWLKVS